MAVTFGCGIVESISDSNSSATMFRQWGVSTDVSPREISLSR